MLDVPRAVPTGWTAAAVRPASLSEQIVEAAASILDKGWKGDYTVNEIVKVAKVGISTLYSRFPGAKDAVTEALMNREMTEVLSHVVYVLEPEGAERELRQLIEAMVERALGRPTMTQMLNLEWQRMRLRTPDEPDRITMRVQQFFDLEARAERAMERRAAFELVALIRNVIDAACAAGERDAVSLSNRVTEAALQHIRHFEPQGELPPDHERD